MLKTEKVVSDVVEKGIIHPISQQIVQASTGKLVVRPYLKYLLAFGDLLSLISAISVASFIQFHWRSISFYDQALDPFFLLSGFVYLFSMVRYCQLGHYVRRKPFLDDLRDIIHVTGIISINAFIVVFLTNKTFPLLLFGLTWFFCVGFMPLIRIVIKKIFVFLGLWQIPTVILGCGKNAIDVTQALASESLMGFDVKAFLAINRDNIPKNGHIEVLGKQIPVLPLGNKPVKTLENLGQPYLIVALETGGNSAFSRLVETLNRYAERMFIVQPMRGLPLLGLETNHFFKHEILLLRIRNNLSRPLSKLFKRIFDIFGSSILLLVLGPLFLSLIWKIRRDCGPAFFQHSRIGRDGQKFFCYKFRTMVPNAHEVLQNLLDSDPIRKAEWDKNYKLKDDPRITPIGKFLRKSSLDELPQLWNVLKGDMSLVGPRPIVQDEVKRYKDNVYYYLNAKPGMTGIWQISGRNDTDYEERVYLDAWYVKNWSIFQDVIILLKTVGVVLKRSGAY